MQYVQLPNAPNTITPVCYNQMPAQGMYITQNTAAPNPGYSMVPVPYSQLTNLQQQSITLPTTDSVSSFSQEKTEEWKTIQHKKRPRNEDSPDNRITKQTTLKDYWLNNPTSTKNRFKPLENLNEDTATLNENNPAESKPPPIFVQKVAYIKPLYDLLNNIAPDNYTLKSLSNNQVKIQVNSPEMYSATIKALTEKQTEFHTYQLKQSRGFRVVIRNIHPSTELEDIKTEIQKLGHVVKNVSNIKQNRTKKCLPLFNIELESKPNNKDIYQITKLLNSIVKVESPNPKRDVLQCQRCQHFGHTRKYCHRNPRCVKCAGNHLSTQCPKQVKENLKCANCSENHPANFRGCTVYKELQKIKFPPLREKSTPQLPNEIAFQPNNQPTTSYAQVTKNANNTNGNTLYTNVLPQQQCLPVPIQQSSNLEQIVQKMLERMDKMLDLLMSLISKSNF